MDSPNTAKMPYRRFWVCSVGCHLRPRAMPTIKASITSQYRRIKACLIVIGLTCCRPAEVEVDQCDMRTINIL
jgi:hypothetical protein